MNKVMLVFGIIGLFLFSGMVSAYQVTSSTSHSYTINYGSRCEFVQEATDFRPERSFGMIGIWGRLSDGSVTCFVPGNRHRPVVVPVVESSPIVEPPVEPPVCEPVTSCHDVTKYREECTCENVCHEECERERVWKKTCEWKHGKLHCNYGWVWEDVCHNECHKERVCEDVPYVEEVCESTGCEA